MSDRIELIDRIRVTRELIMGLETKYGEDSILDDQTRAEVQQKKDFLALLENQLASLPTEEEAIPEPNPIKWIGPDNRLVDLFLTLREKHYIEETSEYKLFHQLVRHFIGGDGKPLKFNNLKQDATALKSAKEFPFECIPENGKIKQSLKND